MTNSGEDAPLAGLGDAVLRSVRGHHAFESCVAQLATAIRLGAYPHGSSLPPERELAELMGVSRATLREAISALRAAGMVRTTRGRGGGTVVSHLPVPPGGTALVGDRAELLDSLDFRGIVEPGAARLAATRAARGALTSAERELLEESLEAVNVADGDAVAHRQADSRLHLAIATVSGSTMTVEAVARVQADLHAMLQSIPVLPRNIDHSNSQHREVVDAVLAGDAELASRVMGEHCADTAALLRGLLT